MPVECECKKYKCEDWVDDWGLESGEIPCNIPLPPPPFVKYIIDPINVFNAKGRLIGYSWHYNDTVTLKVYLDESVLSIYKKYTDEFEMFLSGKTFKFVFTDIRGNEAYCLQVTSNEVVLQDPYRIELPLNTRKSNTIAKNTYSLRVIMVDEDNDSQINIFKEPYTVYVS